MVPMYVSLLYDEGGNGGFRMVAPSRAEEKKRKSKKRRWTQWMDGAVVVVLRVKEEQRSTNQFFFLLPTQKKEKGKSQVKRLTRDFFTLFFSLTLATRRHLAVGIEGSKSGFFKFVSVFSTTRLQIPPKQMIIKMNK